MPEGDLDPQPLPGSRAYIEARAAAEQQQQNPPSREQPPNPRSVGHSPSRDHWNRVAERDANPQPAQQPEQSQADPADAPKFKVGKYEVSETELGAMMDRQAQADLRKATLPASADAYRIELPEGTTLPTGQKFEFNTNDPGLAAVRNLAHAKGWSQSDLSDVLAIYASHVAQQEATLAESRSAEIAKTGPNGPQRVEAVSKWVTSLVGQADAKPILETLCTDAHLRFYEKLMVKHVSQGAPSFTQSHRVPPDTGKIPGFENMSFEQQRLAQDQLRARTGR